MKLQYNIILYNWKYNIIETKFNKQNMWYNRGRFE